MTSKNKGENNTVKKIIEIGSLLGLKEKDIEAVKMTATNNEKVTINCPAHAYNNSAGVYGTISIKDFFNRKNL